MTELTTAPSGAPLNDEDIFLVRVAGRAGVSKVKASELAEYIGAGDGGGGSADYPAFAGHAGDVLAVNGAEDGVEWIDAPAGSGGGSGGALKGLTILSRGSNFALDSGVWTTIPFDVQTFDNLAAYSDDDNTFTVPAGVTLMRVSAAIAFGNGVGAPLLMFRNITSGDEILMRLAAQQYESGIATASPWVAVEAGDVWDLQANVTGSNRFIAGSGEFGGPSTFSIEWAASPAALIGSGGGGGSAEIVPSWSYGAGEKRGRIACSTTGTSTNDPNWTMAGYPQNNFFWGNANLAAPKTFVFDFLEPNIVQGIACWQNTFESHGIWSVEGSHDGATWELIIDDYAWGGASYGIDGTGVPGNGYVREFDNETAYRYYRLNMNPGSVAHNNPYITQITFKCEPL